MLWVVKITESLGQTRITLPKEFCKKHKINNVEYLIINDNDPEQITIGRFEYGKAKEGKN